jgi:hypothetical protein
MDLLLFFSVFLNSAPVLASESSWYCKEVASERKGDLINACGIGKAKEENEARTIAFENARKEFFRVCGLSESCTGHEVNASPERTTCETDGKSIKCYRLIVFKIGPKKASPPTETPTPAPPPASPAAEPSALSSPASTPSPTPAPSATPEPEAFQDVVVKEVFKPFVYTQIRTNPKVSVGMAKADLLRQFGAPERITEYQGSRGTTYTFWYDGKMCIYSISSCKVRVEDDRVYEFEDFKPIYTDLLK